jgi:hypothetical protein
MSKVSIFELWRFVRLRPLLKRREVTEVKAMYEMRSEYYAVDDDVLPILNLHQATGVRKGIEETGVKLSTRPRIYEWPRGCPDVCPVWTGFHTPRSGPQKDDL